ncbi:MAG: PH domain-containing protein [Acidobacteriota bacterium]
MSKLYPVPQRDTVPAISRANLPVGRLEVGSPIPSEEQLIWEGHPSFAYSLPHLFWSAVFFLLWLFLYSSRNALLDVPDAARAVTEIADELNIAPRELLQYVAYVLVFFMFLNVLKVIRTILRHINTTYTITTQRIVIQTGILNISSHQIELFRLKDYSRQQTLWARICGYVNVNVVSSDRILPHALLWGLPHARHITESMRRAAQIARSESGSVAITE